MALIPVKSYGLDDRRTIKTIRTTARPQTTINLLTPATASETTIGALGLPKTLPLVNAATRGDKCTEKGIFRTMPLGAVFRGDFRA